MPLIREVLFATGEGECPQSRVVVVIVGISVWVVKRLKTFCTCLQCITKGLSVFFGNDLTDDKGSRDGMDANGGNVRVMNGVRVLGDVRVQVVAEYYVSFVAFLGYLDYLQLHVRVAPIVCLSHSGAGGAPHDARRRFD